MGSQKSTQFSLWLPNELREKLEEIANNQGRSLANLIVLYLKDAVKNE